MYEKPQYLTKDGFKRLAKNPHGDDVPKFKPVPGKKSVVKTRLSGKGIKISDKTAKMIAMALKEMLKDR